MKGKIVPGAIQALLVLLFMYTAFSKLFAMEDFTGTMYNQPIPHRLALVLSRAIPSIEIVTAISLLFPKAQRAGLYVSFALLTLFTLYIGAILLHVFRKIPCSCGGIFRHLSWQQHLWINLLLIFLTGVSLVSDVKKDISSPLNRIV